MGDSQSIPIQKLEEIIKTMAYNTLVVQYNFLCLEIGRLRILLKKHGISPDEGQGKIIVSVPKKSATARKIAESG